MGVGVTSERELRARAEDRLRVLTSAMQAFAETTMDEVRLLDVIARSVAEIVKDECVVYLSSDDGKRLAPAGVHGADPAATARLRSHFAAPVAVEEHGATSDVLLTGKTYFVPRVALDAIRTTAGHREASKEIGVHSLMIVALRARGHSLGILAVSRSDPKSPAFDEADRELAESLASQAALAVDTSRAYASEKAARLAAEQATAALRVSQARFSRLAESGTIGILITETEGETVVDVNDALVKMVGYSREELLASTPRWAALTAPGWAHVDTLARERIRESGVAPLREKAYLRRDGTELHALVGSAIVEGTEAISFVVDLTARKEADAELARLTREHETSALFRGLLEAAPDAMVVVDAEGRITVANRQAERAFGYTRLELVGQSLDLALPADVLRQATAAGPGGDDRTATVSGDFLARRKDGTSFPAEVTTASLEVNGATLVTAAVRDVTERTCAHDALVEAKVALEDANRELETFSYAVAHDLRTPLRAVSGFAGILRETNGEKLDAEGTRSLGVIDRAASEMSLLIDSLLSLSRVARAPLQRDSVDLSTLATEIVSRLARESLRPVVTTVAEGLSAEADPTLVRALLENLIGNAWKFSGKAGAPRVEVGSREAAGVTTFFIADNGAGFDMTYASRLFSPFQRLHTTQEFPGTGVGLATVQRIVHRHGGRIWAEGIVGSGATFFFTLPAARVEV